MSVERDRTAWRWSWGAYSETPGPGRLTTGEMRKLTGKAAEIAALLIQLPVDTDLFKAIEAVQAGELYLRRSDGTVGVRVSR